MNFLIPPDETPEQATLRKRQAVAQALTAPMPQDMGQGMASLGNALAMRERQRQAAYPQAPGGAQPNFITAMKNLLSGGQNGGLY